MPFFIRFWTSSWSCDLNSSWRFHRLPSYTDLLFQTVPSPGSVPSLVKGPSTHSVTHRKPDALLGLFPLCSPSVQSLVFCRWWNSLCPHLLPRPCTTTLKSPRTGFLPPSLHLFTFHSHSVLFKRLSLGFANSPSVIYLALSTNASLNNVPLCSPPDLARASFSAWNTPLYFITPCHSRSFLGKVLFILSVLDELPHPLGALIHSSGVGLFPLLCVPIEPCTFSVIIFVLLRAHVCRDDLCILSAEPLPGP